MRRIPLLIGAGFIVLTPALGAAAGGGSGRRPYMTVVHAAGGEGRVREYVMAYAERALASAHAKIPAWARKYNMNCSGCHYPAVPRLNATGLKFKWAGYRMPEEIGEDAAVQNLANYVAARGRLRYEYEKEEGQPAAASGFEVEDLSVFFAGGFGKNYGAFLEVEREAADEVEVNVQVAGVWGKEQSFGTLRVGVGHWLADGGVAGFDRPTGIRRAAPVGSPTTLAVPFTFATDLMGLEASYVAGRNRAAVQILNGIDPGGAGDGGDSDTRKDFVATDQFLLDEGGSAVTAVGYYGRVVGLDASAPAATSRFWRLGLSANKIVSNVELLGGFVYSKDDDLPVGGGSPFTQPQNTGSAYWLSGQYHFKNRGLTVFGRYEFLDPDTGVPDNANRRYLIGSVLSVSLPEYLRLALEYALDNPQGAGAAKLHSVLAEVQLSF